MRVFAGERQNPSLNPRLPCLAALSVHLAQRQTSELLHSLGAASSELGYLLSLSASWFFQFLLHRGARAAHPRRGRNSEMHGEKTQKRSPASIPRGESGPPEGRLKQGRSQPPPWTGTLLQARAWTPKLCLSDKKATCFQVPPGSRISRQPECVSTHGVGSSALCLPCIPPAPPGTTALLALRENTAPPYTNLHCFRRSGLGSAGRCFHAKIQFGATIPYIMITGLVKSEDPQLPHFRAGAFPASGRETT